MIPTNVGFALDSQEHPGVAYYGQPRVALAPFRA
jgi:hypothetical protein